MRKFNRCIAMLLLTAMLLTFMPVPANSSADDTGSQIASKAISVPAISSPFTTHPSVFIVEDTYQIAFITNANGMAWVEIGGIKYNDSTNGLVNWNSTYHKITVPQTVLDAAGSYKICFRSLAERPAYNPAPGSTVSRTYPFYPMPSDREPVFFCASDQHEGNDDQLKISKSRNFDVYVFDGDYINDLSSSADLKMFLDMTGSVTQGTKPTIYARGNHEIRGSQTHNLFRVAGYSEETGFYYTVKMPGIFGLVLDAGEDKADSHAEYGGTVQFAKYREDQTKWLRQVVQSREWEKYPVRMVFIHVPFSFYASGEFASVYKEWTELLDQMGVSLVISGHTHLFNIYGPNDAKHKSDPNFTVAVISDGKNSTRKYSASFVKVGSDKYTIDNVDSALNVRSNSVDIFNNAYVKDVESKPIDLYNSDNVVISSSTASSASVPSISSPYTLHPTVYAVEDGYQIIFTTDAMGMGWVNVGGKNYYDQDCGILNYRSKYHKVHVPREALDSVRGYTVNFQSMTDRAAYNPTHGSTVSRTYPFTPMADKKEPVILSISDFRGFLNEAKATAAYKNFDALYIGGDFSYYGNTEAQVKVLLDTASALTSGTKPVIYARGNLEIRGNQSHLLQKMAPSTSTGKSYYTIEQPDFFAIVLDTGEDKVDTHAEYGSTVDYQKFRKEQTEWLKKVLADGKWKDYPTRIVFCHMPIALNNTSSIKEDFAEWIKILNQMGVTIMISGHNYTHTLYTPNDSNYVNAANFATLVSCNVNNADFKYSSSFITLGTKDIKIESVSAAKKLLKTTTTPNVTAPTYTGDSYLLFDYMNDTLAKDRYHNFIYGGINFDLDCYWDHETNTTAPDITRGFLTFSPTSDTVTSVGIFSRPAGNKYGKWGFAPLHYITKTTDYCQIRFKIDNAVAADSSGVAKFRLDIDCPNDLDETTTAKDTYTRFEQSFNVADVVGKGYVTITIPLDTAKYAKMDYINVVHPQFVGLKSASGSTAVFTVDYFYIGTEENFPKYEDNLFFDFTDTAEDQERYNNTTYNYQNYDDPSNWSSYLASPMATIADGALKLTIPSGNTDTNFSIRNLCQEPGTLHFVPGDNDILQVRIQLKNAVSTRADGISNFVMAFDRPNFLPGPDGNNRLWSQISFDFVLADYVDKGWFILEAPITDTEYLNADWINVLHPQFKNAVSASGKDAEFQIDYIYIGPKEKNPASETVIFFDEDGTELDRCQVNKYTPAVYSGKTPTKLCEKDGHYIFAGWKNENGEIVDLNTIIESATLYPVFEKEVHKVKFTLTKEPTLESTGSIIGVCSTCSFEEEVTLPILNEIDYTVSVITAPTCIASGESTYTWNKSEYGNYSFKVTTTTSEHRDSQDNRCDDCGCRINEADLLFCNLSLSGNIAINYYMDLSDEVLQDENAYMLFTFENGETIKIPASQATKTQYLEYTLYVFSCERAAPYMTDIIKSQFFYDGGQTEEATYSVKIYADRILANNSSEPLRNLIYSMLNYGAASQLHFNHNTDRLANEGLTVPDYTTISIDGYPINKNQGTSLVSFKGASLLLDSETTLRIYLDVDSSVAENIKVKYQGKELTLGIQSGVYYADILNIAAHNLDETFTLTIDDGTETAKISYCPLSYCSSVLENSKGLYNRKLQDCVAAIYLYNIAANEYINSLDIII